MRMVKTTRRALGGLALAALCTGRARAEAYPVRPVRLVIPFAAGTEIDLIGRALATPLREALGQPVVIDNRPGAASVLGTQHVAQSRADGYTLLMTSGTTVTITPHLFQNLPFRTEQLQPVSMLMRGQFALYCNARLPVRSIAELLAHARTRRHPLHHAANRGTLAHLYGERFSQAAGIELVDVAYRGTPAAQQLLLRDDVQLCFDAISPWVGLVDSGDVRVLAVTGERPIPALPNAPTFAQAGFAEAVQPYWAGLFAPAGTPQPVLDRIWEAVAAALREARLGENMLAQGAVLAGSAPDAFAAQIAAERQAWGGLIARLGLRMD